VSCIVSDAESKAGLLREDYTVLCPSVPGFITFYSAACILIYPLGIPVAMIMAMRYMHVREIVKEKMDSAKVSLNAWI
jgi:hypothetical protein